MTRTMLCACAAAGQSWNGTWKLTGDTFVITDKGNGMLHSDTGKIQYDMACDGKPYPTGDGKTDTCTGSPQKGYDDVTKEGDKVVERQHSVLSADGKTWTMHETEIQADGTALHGTDVYERLSGTTGFVGKWQVEWIEVIEMRGDWIKICHPLLKTTVEGKMDGSDLKGTGTDGLSGETHAFKRDGPNRLHVTVKYKGKITQESIQTLSPDGKTILEETWTPGKENEKRTWVWQRQ